MRIGINLLFLVPKKVGGTETYAKGLITALQKVDRENLYYLFCNVENSSHFKETKNFKVVKVPIKGSMKGLRLIFEQLVMPFYLIKLNIDVIHSLGYSGPFLTHCTSIVTIHDLNWYYYPEDFGKIERRAWAFFTVGSAKFSNYLITVSISSKNHIMKVLKVPNSKIFTVYNGTPHLKKPSSKNRILDLGIRKKYIFTLSASYPHKNLITLFKAYREIRDRGYDLVLIVAGLGGRAKGEILSFIEENDLNKFIKILGWVSDKDLSTLYKHAEVVAFPSLHEGFGFPLVEAFSIGTPVVSSNAFSLKEIADDAAILVDPLKYNQFADEIIKVISIRKIRRKLIQKGKRRALDFSWQSSATKMVEIYQKVQRSK